MGDDEGQALRHVEHAQRRDEGRNLELGDEDPVQGTHEGPGGQCPDDAEPDGQVPVGEKDTGHHGAEGHHGTDAEVDARGDDDEGDAEGKDSVHRCREHYGDQVVGLEEIGRGHGEDDEQEDEAGEGQ